MASFQAKIGWKMPRKRKTKIIGPVRSVPTRRVIENSKTNAEKLENYGLIPSQNRSEKAEKEEK